tara:strand:+ start:7771 stop:10215 length:2445 start_codon:yes stop_codon:yes gene_type:complete
MNEENNYTEVNNKMIQDLFEECWDDLETGKMQETITGMSKKQTLSDTRIAFVLSQKASNLLQLQVQKKIRQLLYKLPDTELILLDDSEEVVMGAFSRLGDGDLFLRTCPETARHGVLESVKVNAETIVAEWTRLRDIMNELEPTGCLILQPFLEATSSAVLHPTKYATIGIGHDGVTAGHGTTLRFNIVDTDEGDVIEDEFKNIGQGRHPPLDDDGEPHIHANEISYELEFVYRRADEGWATRPIPVGDVKLTQVRNAPPPVDIAPPFEYDIISGETKISVYNGVIPIEHKVVVTNILTMTGLESVMWLEENVSRELCPKGYFVLEPTGNMSSHIMAHCRTVNVPYGNGVDIEEKLQVGDTWVEGSSGWIAKEQGIEIPIADNIYNPWNQTFIEAFKDGLEATGKRYQRQHGWFSHFFHQYLGTGANGLNGAFLAGGFVGWITKAALSVGFGELRHGSTLCQNTSVELFPTISAAIGLDNIKEASGVPIHNSMKNRQHYYASMENTDVSYAELAKALRWCSTQFSLEGWRNSYGGKKWATCMSEAALIADLAQKFVDEPTVENITSLCAKANECENWQHNTGSLYNKFLRPEAFDYGTKPFKVDERGLDYMFRTYELAMDFLEKDNVDVKSPSDWSEIFDFLSINSTTGFWRHNMITKSSKIPIGLRTAAIECGPSLLHHPNKFTKNVKLFIPCGHDDCSQCASLVDASVLTEDLVDSPNLSLLMTDAMPSVFFALTNESSAVETYAVCAHLKNKEYDLVTPRKFYEAWCGMNPNDRVYKILHDIMRKFMQRQVTHDKKWSGDMGKIMKQGSEQ